MYVSMNVFGRRRFGVTVSYERLLCARSNTFVRRAIYNHRCRRKNNEYLADGTNVARMNRRI
jgi:hypothetical protein